MENKRLERGYSCTIAATVNAVGGKWKTTILLHLRDRTLRFGELQRVVRVSQKVLTQQLKELEHDGIVRRQVYAEVPPRVEYSLSAFGLSLLPVLDALYDWGVQYYLHNQPAAAAAFLASVAVADQPGGSVL